MNFQSLKTMIDNLIQSYQCPNCQSGVGESNVEVVGTAGSSINVEVECPECGKHSIVRAQVFSVDVPNLQLNEEKISELKEKLNNISDYKEKIGDIQALLTEKKNNKDSIKDAQIVELNKQLKSKHLNISDLFKNEEDESK